MGLKSGDKSKTGQDLKSHGKDLGCDLNIRVKPLNSFKKKDDKIMG